MSTHFFSFFGGTVNESVYQRRIIRRLEKEFPGCVVIINDPSRRQGIPDLLVLHNEFWATLEVKRSRTARIQPNQEYYVEAFAKMSYSTFIYPENEEQVFNDLQIALRSRRQTRLS